MILENCLISSVVSARPPVGGVSTSPGRLPNAGSTRAIIVIGG